MATINGKPNRDDTLLDTSGDDEIYGFSGNDTITVTGGNDSVYGDVGLDRLIIDWRNATGGIGNYYQPGANADLGGFNGSFTGYGSVSYSSIEAFTITTGSGNDSINTATGDDAVSTGAGDDVVNVGSGKDTADGGVGSDGISADLSALTTAVGWNLGANTFAGTGRSFTNFEYFGTVSGGSAGDTFVSGKGGFWGETINGNDGNDVATVFDGSDVFNGGAGTDRLVIDYAAATGGVGNYYQPGANGTLGGFDGSFTGYGNVSYSSVEAFTITTGSGNDTIRTATGDDVVVLGLGDDFADVVTGNDTANGGDGSDGISADLSAVTTAITWNLKTNVFAGAAGRSFTNFEYFGTVSGGSAGDTFVSGQGGYGETINGNGGNDSATVFGGNDTFNGGSGTDTLVVDWSLATGGISNYYGPGANGDLGGVDGSFSGYGYVSYSSVEKFAITTGSGGDSITTWTGDDVVKAGDGDDTVNVASGLDVADGGTGNDRISADLSTLTANVTWNLQTNTFTGGGARSFKNFEAFGAIATGSGNDTIVSGKIGAGESIDAGAGNDTVTVFDGSDSVAGGLGTDRLIVDYSAATGGISNYYGPGTNTTLGGLDGSFNGYGYVSYSSIENFTITTGSGGDSITTAGGDDVVRTGDGDDFVNVVTGNDTADGGAGTDAISADLSALTTAVKWDLSKNSFTGAGHSFTNFEYFGTITTGSGADTIVTGAGFNESVTTGEGADTVTVRGGSDGVGMGAGLDTLVVDYSAADRDIYNYSGPNANATLGGFDGAFAGWAYVGYSSVERFVITTGSGNDTITAAGGDDVVKTGAGNDFVNVGTGTDSADGGDGVDGITADLSDATGAVLWNLQTNSYVGGPDTYLNFEYFGTITTGSGNDVIVSGATGRGEQVNTGAGDDTFTTVDGSDGFAAGGGSDTLVIDFSTATGDIYNYSGPNVNASDGGFDGAFSGNRYVGYSSVETFVVTTNVGNDTITTATGNDVVRTGAGNDTVNVGTGTDFADGGEGFDGISADLTDATAAVLWNLQTNSFAGGPDSFTNFEYFNTVTTGDGNDVIVTGATGRGEQVNTGAGDDSFTTVDGGDGFGAGTGTDTLVIDFSTATGDIYNYSGPNANAALGGFDGAFSGNRSVGYSSVEIFAITTGTGNDSITTASGADTIRTGAGNDGVNAGAGNDLVDGGDGADSLNGGDDVDTVTYASAAAAVTVTLALTTQQDTLGAGLDTLLNFENLTGSAFNDTLTGTDGANVIDGSVGADAMTGGLGDDTYAVDDAGDTVTEQDGGGTDTVRSSISYTLGATLENLALTGSAAIDGTGNAGANVLIGNDAANTLDGKAGADTMAGGLGDDTYVVDDAGDTVNEAMDAGADTVRSAIGYTLGANVENLTLTGPNAIDGTGNELANTLTGNDAANTLDGKLGADTLVGKGGNDGYVVDDAGDVVVEAANEGTDTVFASISYTLTANVENLTLTGSAALGGTGNALANVLTGNAAANVLDGAGGVDTMVGGAGDDTYIVDATAETVTELAGGGVDTVRSSATFTLSANVENLVLTGSAAIGGTGNAGANVMTGNGAANTIDGGLGNDTLDGGAGIDTASYASATSGVTVSLATSAAQATGGAGTDTLANFEALLGSAFGDTLTGNAGANTLNGAVGDDTLVGGGGADQLIGGAGIDTAVFTGGFLDYDVTLASGSYTVADRRSGAPDGRDTLTTVERVTLSSGTYAVADVVNQGPTGVADTASVTEAGRDGAGVASATGSVLANDLDPNLQVAGLGETLTVTGARAGSSGTFTAVGGATVLNGVYGTLTINADGSYSYQLDNTRAATDQLAPGQVVQDVFAYTLADGHGVASQATLSVAVTGSDDTVAGNDTLQVTQGRTSGLDLSVLLGDDHGATGETLSVVSVGNATGGTVAIVDGKLAITASAASGGFDYVVQTSGGGTATGHVDFDAIAATRKIVATAPANADAVDYVGGAFADKLTGGAGTDHLVGGGGRDTLDGGVGADRMEGGEGADSYFVDNAGDLVVETGGGLDVVTTTLASYTLTAGVEQLVFAGTGAFTGTGNAVNNTITGGSGADTLSGGDGADQLTGGLGDDRLDGGAGVDTVRYAGATGGVIVDLRIAGPQDTRGAGSDTLVSIENVTGSNGIDIINGSDSNNVLSGGGNRDTLFGNGGNDTLIGGVASDTLWGGRGADTFVYQAVTEFAGDRIADFLSTQGDKIDVSAIDLDPVADGVQGFSFIGAAAFSGAAGTGFELRYQPAATAGELTVQGDINHDGVADFSFTVVAATLQASDFVL